MKLSGKGLCTVFSSTILFVCALCEVVVGLRCISLGSTMKAHFHLGVAAGAFYSGLLVGIGQVLLVSALLCRRENPGCRNFFLLGVVVFLLGVLSAFSGAVVDGDTASLVGRKYSHHCFHLAVVNPACEQLRDYQRTLVISTVLSTLECVLGLINLVVIKRYKRAQYSRSRQSQRQRAGAIILSEERDCSSVDFQPVSYINLGVFNVFDEVVAEVQCGGHPSSELPGYSPTDPELNHSFPYSYPLPTELPPAYGDIFPLRHATNSLSGAASSSTFPRLDNQLLLHCSSSPSQSRAIS
ncbi:transmembrane protein 271-like [Notolabrus celidotus]|uniref:transmembrane protein 271-like n=1 Tax=Notolabrus celidotus TaxID=1203425 RepID=UPI00148F4FCC|nr:transmembrane protein 271-like [Notolabrus celidotus]